MKPWKRAFKDAVISGTLAGLTSMAALALGGRKEIGTPWGPLNAPSHWLWGRRALRQNATSTRYTATGLLIHQLSAGFWGVLHEKLLGNKDQSKTPAALMRDAALTTAVAAVVDLALVPERLTPGFQKRLSAPSLVGVYSLFALGLAAGSYIASRRSAA